MSKKDFEVVARTFRAEIETADAMFEQYGAAAIRATATAMADAFAAAYPRFDRDRFLAACGV